MLFFFANIKNSFKLFPLTKIEKFKRVQFKKSSKPNLYNFRFLDFTRTFRTDFSVKNNFASKETINKTDATKKIKRKNTTPNNCELKAKPTIPLSKVIPVKIKSL